MGNLNEIKKNFVQKKLLMQPNKKDISKKKQKDQ